MSFLRSVALLQILAAILIGQAVSKPLAAQAGAEALVRDLYKQVLTRHPIGIPDRTEMEIFAPYLSKNLLHRIEVARACGNDWGRKHPNPDLKPPFAWLESGLFSGDDEQAEPQSFQIERAESEKDGAFRVYVRLTWEEPPARAWRWRVAVIVIRENARFRVNDVIYLKDQTRATESRLSEYLSAGCNGPRWVGDKR